jgi:hypothetical protein
MEMPTDGEFLCINVYPDGKVCINLDLDCKQVATAVPVPPHGRLIDADALTEQMERNLWAIEDKAEKELGFDETLRRGMQYGHAVCLDAVNDAAVIFAPQIVHCCECEYNNNCLTQEFVEDASKIPFDKNTWFCADAKAAPIIIPSSGGKEDE